eukprot:GHVR01048032.1.p1 GENE.GHVR01048032.1~~GHVR01048032.1.p1  ORF type:complete len:141 (+),score=29.25 GHVR01048032.1:32-424(+)
MAAAVATSPASMVDMCPPDLLSGEILGEGEDAEAYQRYKTLQRQLEFIEVQEEYIKEEQKNLKRELVRAKEEIKRIQSVPLVIGQFLEMIDAHYGIVASTVGTNYHRGVEAVMFSSTAPSLSCSRRPLTT